MEYIVSAFIIAFEVYSVVLFFDAFFLRSHRDTKFWSIVLIFYAAHYLIVNGPLDGQSVIRPFFTVWVYFAMVLCLYGKRNAVLKATLCVMWMAFCIGTDLSVAYGISALMRVSIATLISVPIAYTIMIVSSKLLLLLIVALVQYLHPVKPVSQKIHWGRLVLLLLFPCVSAAIMVLLLQVGHAHPKYGNLFFVGSLSLTLVNIFLFAMLDRLEKDAQMREETVLRIQQTELQMESLRSLQNAYAAQRKATHDYNKHLAMLQGLLDKNHPSVAREYLDNLLKQTTTRIMSVRTGHAIIDVLFNQKYLTAQSLNIDMQFCINDLSGIVLKAEDMVVLLANLLDNALEACARVLEKREIQVEMSLQEGEIFLSVRNTCVPVKIVNNFIASTKADPFQHGYGLQSIKTILAIYHGDFILRYADGYFQFTASIQNIPVL